MLPNTLLWPLAFAMCSSLCRLSRARRLLSVALVRFARCPLSGGHPRDHPATLTEREYT